MPVSRRFENISGSRVAFLETTGEAPVLLIHGFFTSCFLWRELAQVHGDGRRFLAPDLEGFGDTHCPSQLDLGFERQTEFLSQFLLARCGLQPVSIVAHSHGVIPALMLAMQKPGLVRDLVLLSPVFAENFPGPLVRPFMWAARSRLSWEAFFHSGLARAIVERHLGRAFVTPGPQHDVAIEDFWRPFANSPTARARLRRVFEECDGKLVSTFSRHLDHVKQPVKVLVGRQDSLVDGQLASRLSSAFPHASCHMVASAGHFLPLEEPDLLFSELF